MSESGPEMVEQELRTVADALTAPLPVECLLCYVWRMLDAFGCNATLRWARTWRDARARRATSLEHRLGRHGAYCDCEIFLNGWVLFSSLHGSKEPDPAAPARFRSMCAGVRRGSTQPCRLWARRPSPWAG
jgi:hypothetical protein